MRITLGKNAKTCASAKPTPSNYLTAICVTRSSRHVDCRHTVRFPPHIDGRTSRLYQKLTDLDMTPAGQSGMITDADFHPFSHLERSQPVKKSRFLFFLKTNASFTPGRLKLKGLRFVFQPFLRFFNFDTSF